ncbi:MAG: hypothetical protein WA919_17120 [Coleofasciculaceae cyanobacterium]
MGSDCYQVSFLYNAIAYDLSLSCPPYKIIEQLEQILQLVKTRQL